jgi:hypothetical protein
MRMRPRLVLATAIVLAEVFLAFPGPAVAADSLTVVSVWPPPGRRPGFSTPPDTFDSGDWVEVTFDYVVDSVPQASVRMDGTISDSRPLLMRGSGRASLRGILFCATELTALRLHLSADGRDLATREHPVSYRAECRPDLAIAGLTVGGLPATAGAVLDLRATSAAARGLRGCVFDVAELIFYRDGGRRLRSGRAAGRPSHAPAGQSPAPGPAAQPAAARPPLMIRWPCASR